MKMTITLLAGLISTLSFAETCFKADRAIPSDSNAPEVICVQDYGLTFSNRAPNIYYSFVNTSLGYKHKPVVFVMDWKGEEFKHEFTLQKGSDVFCSRLNETVVSVSFKVDELAQNKSDSLSVKAEYTYSWDTCHMEPQTEVISYSKI
jgi:hypothetical protein